MLLPPGIALVRVLVGGQPLVLVSRRLTIEEAAVARKVACALAHAGSEAVVLRMSQVEAAAQLAEARS